jgi:hypothetical protein
VRERPHRRPHRQPGGGAAALPGKREPGEAGGEARRSLTACLAPAASNGTWTGGRPPGPPSPRAPPELSFSIPATPTPPVGPLQISMYINSPGGVVTAGLAIYDTMQVQPATNRHPALWQHASQCLAPSGQRCGHAAVTCSAVPCPAPAVHRLPCGHACGGPGGLHGLPAAGGWRPRAAAHAATQASAGGRVQVLGQAARAALLSSVLACCHRPAQRPHGRFPSPTALPVAGRCLSTAQMVACKPAHAWIFQRWGCFLLPARARVQTPAPRLPPLAAA